MNPWLVAALAVVAILVQPVLAMVEEELRARIEAIPYALLRLASLRVPPELRASLYDEEWLPELRYLMADAGRLPVTTVVKGTCFSFGLLRSARLVARELAPVRAHEPMEHARGVPLKLLIGALAAAISFVSGFGVFGALAGAIVSLTGGFVVVTVVFSISHDLRELSEEREPPPWA
ncbi:MAG TPA: hypothetical protein VOB72_23270 [Candidatus Dormibacteraeota bacterium]|nr:hypothetical protein [Candidatus Dormibacteraeota bacterium]